MTQYTCEEVRKASIEYFKGDELAAEVFVDKYALRDLKGHLYELTPDQMHKRLAREFAKAEKKYPNPLSQERILELFSAWDLVPQGSPMSAVGNDFQFQSLSNCFVIESPHDSYGGILKADQEQAQIMKRRGGVGFDISSIRPRGMYTSNAARTTDGIGVFMERFSRTCREVAQGGRRGALMLTLSIHHPEVKTFIEIKRDEARKKVKGANVSLRLTDEFMEAVESGGKVQLRFPVDPNVEHVVEEEVDAAELFNDIVEAAHDCAEPGLLFWDTIERRGPADVYPQFKSVATNPCVTGDVLVAVADGRGYVPIGDLATTGDDVPVFAVNDSGKLVVRQMRNPRVTGKNVPVYRVVIEGGHSFKATANHTMIMRDGSRKRVDELASGDQLWIAHKVAARFHEALSGYKATQSQDYWWVKDCNSRSWKTEHRHIWEFNHDRHCPVGHVIHHVDFNALNNTCDNLQLMSKKDHDSYHASLMRGKNNPIFKIKADPIRFAEYSAKMSESVSGINNPRAYANISHEDIRDHVLSLTKKLGHRVSLKEWYKYAKQSGLPMSFSTWRQVKLGSFYDLSVWAANELGLSNVELDTRIQRTLLAAVEQGYDADIVDGKVQVNRTCEWCDELFIQPWGRREIAFCSHSCSNLYANRKAGKNEARKASLRAMHVKKAEKTRETILDYYTELRFNLQREPLQCELRSLCKERNIPYRTGTENGFKNWGDIKEHAASHNHRIVSIEPCGSEDVYNGTVDEDHTLCIALGEETLERFQNKATLIIASEQCGEITLSPYDSCRLLLVNLANFVTRPFLSEATFDYERFGSVVRDAQKLMDDLVDMEITAVDRIIAKIKSDPEPDDVKEPELRLWVKIRQAAVDGRRTGLGITGLGDTLAMVGVCYGTDASIKITEEIYRNLALNSYRSSVTMAQERGAFPAFSLDVEKGHPFIEQIMAEDNALRDDYLTFGRRNIANTTTAPAGSTSILTQTTSGGEPAFNFKYGRRRKVTDVSIADEVDSSGDAWQFYQVFHHGFKQWMDATGKEDPEESPYWGAVAGSIDWVKKIEMQAAAQKWVCHSISNTTNLPGDISIDVVKEIYLHGWRTGCKGVTIYREGSRDDVLVNSNKTKILDENGLPLEIGDNHAPKRQKELPCDILRTSVKGELYLVLVGLLKDRPYEVFCGLSEHVEIPRKIKRGVLIKNGKVDGVTAYDLRIPFGDDDDLVIKNIAKMFDNPVHGVLTRTLSLALRHGVPIQYIVEQLRRDKHSDLMDFSKVMARMLSKHYVPDGTAATTFEKKCSNCGSDQLAYQSGCVTCMTCGNSKCY